jgi:hypothetical protein
MTAEIKPAVGASGLYTISTKTSVSATVGMGATGLYIRWLAQAKENPIWCV